MVIFHRARLSLRDDLLLNKIGIEIIAGDERPAFLHLVIISVGAVGKVSRTSCRRGNRLSRLRFLGADASCVLELAVDELDGVVDSVFLCLVPC